MPIALLFSFRASSHILRELPRLVRAVRMGKNKNNWQDAS